MSTVVDQRSGSRQLEPQLRAWVSIHKQETESTLEWKDSLDTSSVPQVIHLQQGHAS